MRLAKDTRQTLGLAIEALIELLDAIGPDPEAEPSLGAPNGTNQAQSWGYDAGTLDDREDEHDGAEPEINEPSLGWTEMEARYNRYAESTDRELDPSERELSLAVPEQINQACAWSHPGNGQELDAEMTAVNPERMRISTMTWRTGPAFTRLTSRQRTLYGAFWIV